jgi:plastocyanin
MVRWRSVFCGLGILSLVACGGGNDASPTSPSPAPPSPSPGGSSVSVAIASGAEFWTTDAFGVNPLTVPVGSTVVWANNDGAPHNPVGDSGTFAVAAIQPGGQGTATFATAGTFAYHCGLHPGMVGTLVVQ